MKRIHRKALIKRWIGQNDLMRLGAIHSPSVLSACFNSLAKICFRCEDSKGKSNDNEFTNFFAKNLAEFLCTENLHR